MIIDYADGVYVTYRFVEGRKGAAYGLFGKLALSRLLVHVDHLVVVACSADVLIGDEINILAIPVAPVKEAGLGAELMAGGHGVGQASGCCQEGSCDVSFHRVCSVCVSRGVHINIQTYESRWTDEGIYSRLRGL